MSQTASSLKADYEVAVENVSSEVIIIDHAIEKRLVHKFDWRLMPMFATMYFFSSLDRSNISNAKVAGMTADLGITDAQYSTVASVLYATYIPVMLPGVWLMKLFKKPRYYLSIMMTCWSMCSLFEMFVNSYGSLLAVRLLIGFFEGSFFSCMAVITTDYYFPHELGRRFAYLFASSSLASAFGGLIATGITEIKSGPLESWRYLFMIEGLLSLVAVIWLLFSLPDSPRQILKSEDEIKVFTQREAYRKKYMQDDSFDRSEIFASLKDFKLYFSVVIQFCQDIMLYGYSTFLPSILKSGLGFNSLQAQYLSVPVYLLAGVLFLVFAEVSDRFKIRGPIIASTNIFAIVGYILILVVLNNAVKYFGCYLICFPLYTGTGINEAWITSNTSPKLKRSTSLAINQALGNVAGIISGQIYRSSPKYILGHAFTLGCLGVSCIAALWCSCLLSKRNSENAKCMETGVDNRNKKRVIGDDAPDFKFII